VPNAGKKSGPQKTPGTVAMKERSRGIAAIGDNAITASRNPLI
jgi:hypothetical protein